MKIRTGFVSNSSSSSFIVAFSKEPENIEELQQMLFGDETIFANPYAWDERPAGWLASEIARYVWQDMHKTDSHALTLAEAEAELDTGYPEAMEYSYEHKTPRADRVREEARAAGINNIRAEGVDPKWDKRYMVALEQDWAVQDRRRRKAEQKLWQNRKADFEGRVIYRFEYEDHSALGSAMEHGDLFRRLPHIRVSHH